jgi:hypothetical protein
MRNPGCRSWNPESRIRNAVAASPGWVGRNSPAVAALMQDTDKRRTVSTRHPVVGSHGFSHPLDDVFCTRQRPSGLSEAVIPNGEYRSPTSPAGGFHIPRSSFWIPASRFWPLSPSPNVFGRIGIEF